MKLMTMAKKFAPRRINKPLAAVGAVLALSAASASANNDITQIGQTAAVEVAKFAIMISAVGAAVLSVVVLIQGFRMAFGMVKTAR